MTIVFRLFPVTGGCSVQEAQALQHAHSTQYILIKVNTQMTVVFCLFPVAGGCSAQEAQALQDAHRSQYLFSRSALMTVLFFYFLSQADAVPKRPKPSKMRTARKIWNDHQYAIVIVGMMLAFVIFTAYMLLAPAAK